MRFLAIVSALLLVPPLGAHQEDPDAACLELLERGEHLTSIDDQDIQKLGRDKIKQAEELCDSQRVSPELRARALILATRLHSDDRMLQLEMRNAALSLLRVERPDSRLLPQAIDAVADTQMALGNYDQALELSREALDERERLFGGQSREYVEGLVWMSIAHKSAAHGRDPREHLALALEHSERAVELATRLFGPHDPSTIGAAIDLISSLERLGRFDEAEELQERIAPYVDLADARN